jgi:hypothetical protein
MARKKIGLRDTCATINRSPSAVERYLRDPNLDPPFPQPTQLTPFSHRQWFEDEVLAWCDGLRRVEYEPKKEFA